MKSLKIPGIVGTGASLFWWDVREFMLSPDSFLAILLIQDSSVTGDRDTPARAHASLHLGKRKVGWEGKNYRATCNACDA